MLEIVATADGSNTIFNSEVGENYHSKHGALQESRHVFLNMGLSCFLENQATSKDPYVSEAVSILEVGFGTGLNFLLSADHCIANQTDLNYTGIEAYPLSNELIRNTGYDQYISDTVWDSFILNYEASLAAPVNLNKGSSLTIAHYRLLEFESTLFYDIIYFDAFAAAHQPEMWNEEAISHTVNFLKPGGVFVTYAITGNLKRTLKALNCKVEKVKGAAGKREMLRAVKNVLNNNVV